MTSRNSRHHSVELTLCNIVPILVFSAKLGAAESIKQTVSSRDSCLRAYMEVFTACLRFGTAAATGSRRVCVLLPQPRQRHAPRSELFLRIKSNHIAFGIDS